MVLCCYRRTLARLQVEGLLILSFYHLKISIFDGLRLRNSLIFFFILAKAFSSSSSGFTTALYLLAVSKANHVRIISLMGPHSSAWFHHKLGITSATRDIC